MQKVCEACGAEHPAGARYCRRCGKPLAHVAIQSATNVTPLLKQWRSLKYDMTRKEVRQALGEPARVQTPDPGDVAGMESWFYEYLSSSESERRARGVVRFMAAEGRLASWTEPEWAALPPDS